MPDDQVRSAIANWGPRFTGQGVDPGDFARVTGGLENWADWLDAWCANGLAGVLHRLTQPMIVVFGQLDRLVPWQQAVQVADEAPGASLWMFDEGNHVCMNMTYRWRPRAADWLAERLAEAD